MLCQYFPCFLFQCILRSNKCYFKMATKKKNSKKNLNKKNLTSAEQIRYDRQLFSAKSEGKASQKKYRLLLQENDYLQKKLDIALQLKASKRTPIVFEHKIGTIDSEAVAFAIASDWHIEETVRPETVDNLNSYSVAIAEKRIEQFFQNTLKLVRKEQKATKIDTLVLALLGDFISGNIHDELLENCSLRPADAIVHVEKLILAGIKYLLQHSELKLVIPCHVGNHTRMTKKVHISTETGNSLETIMYYQLKNYFAGNPRVEIIIAPGYLSYHKVYDFNVCFQHGHAVRFQGGVGGLTIPLNKAIAQWEKARHADLYVLGHWHTRTDGGNAIVNGSLIGYNAFAQFIKASYEKPSQVFFLVDKKRGCKTVVCPILSDC